MENLLKILEWFSKSPTSTILIVVATFGCLFGVALLGLGTIGRFWNISLNEAQATSSRKTGKWLAIASLILLLTVAALKASGNYILGLPFPFHTFADYLQIGLIVCALALTFYLIRQTRTRLREMRELPDKLKNEIVSSVSKEIKDETDLLVKAERELVGNVKEATEQLVDSVEDATRHVLVGFPQIFDRALQLLAEADRELWFINFVFNFGQCHLEAIQDDYNKLPVTDRYRKTFKKNRRSFAEDVTKFRSLLITKAGVIPKVNLLTICDGSAEANFLKPLFDRPKYEKLFPDSKAKEARIKLECQNITEAKNLIQNRVRDSRSTNVVPWQDDNIEHSSRLYDTNTLPIQVLIAGKTGEEKTGCLVFMVGTEILRAAKSDVEAEGENPAEVFYEPGFYTELREVVDVYKSLADALLKQAKADYNAATEKERQGRRIPYDGA